MKMKRKDLDQFNDEFSDFSLSAPAWKIRRLDVGLPPIIEEEESPEGFGVRIEELPDAGSDSGSGCAMEDRVRFVDNQERAIVLFKPVNSSFSQSASPLSVSVDSGIISGFKSEILRENCYDGRLKFSEDDEEMGTDENKNLAVVPWVPRLQVPAPTNMHVSHEEAPQLMEAEEDGDSSMDIEEDNLSSQQSYGFGGMDGANAIHQWHQQHCMIPQLPQQTSSPIAWFR